MPNEYADKLVRDVNLKRAKELHEIAQALGDPSLYEKAAGFYEAAGMDFQATKCKLAAEICRKEDK